MIGQLSFMRPKITYFYLCHSHNITKRALNCKENFFCFYSAWINQRFALPDIYAALL